MDNLVGEFIDDTSAITCKYKKLYNYFDKGDIKDFEKTKELLTSFTVCDRFAFDVTPLGSSIEKRKMFKNKQLYKHSDEKESLFLNILEEYLRTSKHENGEMFKIFISKEKKNNYEKDDIWLEQAIFFITLKNPLTQKSPIEMLLSVNINFYNNTKKWIGHCLPDKYKENLQFE